MNATQLAIDELKKVLNSEETPESGIRIFSQQGCCGPALQLTVTENGTSGDNVVTIDSVNFYIAPDAVTMLEGVTLDFGSNGFRLEGLRRAGGGCCG
ncbi:MAG: iron-sulfur cluster biosynthesis family protein [Bacteroidales bacterium]|nr:iron-sulfur cluster biosynthesis family protein [Bacteroidales bacterium]